MTAHAPSDVWITILKYAISVPIFFDPDEIAERFPTQFGRRDKKFIWNDTRPYWESERQRNILQRVCKEWHNFLKMFEHRYVRTIDIQHEIIPETALAKAIRVYFNDMRCECSTYCFPVDPNTLEQRPDKREERYRRAFGGDPPVKMEIACVRDKFGPEPYLFYEFGHNLTNLKTLLIPETYKDEVPKLGGTVNRMPNLRHIFVCQYMPSLEEEHPISSGLVSLAFEDWGGLTVQDFEPKYWQLPSLQNLVLNTFLGAEDDVVLLRTVGSELLSLEWCPSSHQELSSEMWTLCPNLLRLRTNQYLTSSPPRTHPIHTLYLTDEYRDQLRSRKKIEDWKNLRRIVFDIVWDDKWVERYEPDLHWTHTLELRGIRLEDLNGQSLDEYLATGPEEDKQDQSGVPPHMLGSETPVSGLNL